MQANPKTITCLTLAIYLIGFAIVSCEHFTVNHYGWEESEQYRNIEKSRSGLTLKDNILTTPSYGEKYNVTLYQDGNREGRVFTIKLALGDCVDFPWTFDDWISSLDTHDNCVLLCKDVGCNTDCQEFGPIGSGKNSGNEFIGADLNDKASSIMLCDSIYHVDGDGEVMPGDDPNAAITRSSGSKLMDESIISNKPGKLFQISLYAYAFFKGHKFEVYISPFDNCLNIPLSFEYETSSVDTHGNCIKLCDQPNCRGKCKRFHPYDSGHWVGDDFNDRASSISLCEINS